MKVSFIATVFNEEGTIVQLLDSLSKQSKMPDEVIIVDGGSTDATASVISNFKFQISNKQIKPKNKFITKPGNRAVGRNEAIRNSTGDIIVCSDAGCVLDKDWVKNITEPFSKKVHLGGVIASQAQPATVRGASVDVVAGYYSAKPNSVFEKCLVPYVLVMPDKVDPKTFLPATRSIAFSKLIWEKAGGFPEKFSHNEDYVFAKKLTQLCQGFDGQESTRIVFAKDAIVYWQPRKNLAEAFIMFFRFAYGDAQAGILRPKVLFLFARYIIGLSILFYAFISKSNVLQNFVFAIIFCYIAWAILKNYKYVNHWQAVFIFPFLQIESDIAVILGTSFGLIKK